MNKNKKLWIIVFAAAVLLIALIVVAVSLGKASNGPSASVPPTDSAATAGTQAGIVDATGGAATSPDGSTLPQSGAVSTQPQATDPTLPIDAVGGSETLGETYPPEQVQDFTPSQDATNPPPPTGAEDPLNEEFDITTLTYEAYEAMNGEQQQAVIDAFSTPEHFVRWYKAAEAAYKAEHPDIEIGDGVIDGSDIGN